MATAKKTGIVATVKKAIAGVFSSDSKLRPSAKTMTVRKTAKKTTVPAKKLVAKKTTGKKAAAKNGASMDRKLIALSEPYEVRDWCKSFGCTEAELKAAVAAVGRSAAKVREHLAKKRGRSMDRKLIALSQPHEVRDWCKSLGCTEAELRAAVGAVGRSAAKVRAHLKA